MGRKGQLQEHGTRARYAAGCKCPNCRRANAERQRLWVAGETDGEVSADAARRHLMKLMEMGVGTRPVADATGIDRVNIFRIRKGERQSIRRSTERAILDVDAGCIADSALVDAKPTWKRIRHLMRDGGFTKKEIARRMGFRSPALHFAKRRIEARTELKVRKFWAYYMER